MSSLPLQVSSIIYMNLLLGISNPRIQMDEKQHLLPGPDNLISPGRQHSGADESQEQLPSRGAAKGAGARPSGGRSQDPAGRLREPFQPGWKRRRDPAPRVTWPHRPGDRALLPRLWPITPRLGEGAGPWSACSWGSLAFQGGASEGMAAFRTARKARM